MVSGDPTSVLLYGVGLSSNQSQGAAMAALLSALVRGSPLPVDWYDSCWSFALPARTAPHISPFSYRRRASSPTIVCTQVLAEDIHVLILTRRSKLCVSVSGFKAAGSQRRNLRYIILHAYSACIWANRCRRHPRVVKGPPRYISKQEGRGA